jgi:hypothetical protein
MPFPCIVGPFFGEGEVALGRKKVRPESQIAGAL